MKARTRLTGLHIERFRALRGVDIEFGDHITVICGKNGTSKSSILGIAAQIFSFHKDYVTDEPLRFKQIAGGTFKSQYSEHFRISNTFDTPGSMDVGIELRDGYTNRPATANLELMKRGDKPRPVVRNNSTARGNRSRNFTHPVIFLSLKRLYPIAARGDYKVGNFDYLDEHWSDFLGLTNELLNQNAEHATGTTGTISSAVAHSDQYDQESVSAGEDNAGQILLALMSFRKLKDEYRDYMGGLLLIDEADAGLFPRAQINLWKILARECAELDLQVIMTSHSPVLIEHAYEQGRLYRRKFRTVYLSDSWGAVQVMQDWSWAQISADINTTTIAMSPDVKLPTVRVYFEDGEACDFFRALMRRQPMNKFIRTLPDITLGCSHYLSLIKNKIPEFSERSIVCLDGDVTSSGHKTVVPLPGGMAPDRLIFEHLYNLGPEDTYWKNDLQFTRSVFTDAANDVIREFGITGDTVDVRERVEAYEGSKKPREVFKQFYKNEHMQQVLSSPAKPYHPWANWIESHPEQANDFLDRIHAALLGIMKNAFGVDEAKLQGLPVKHKKT